MKARLVIRERVVYTADELVEMVVWEVPQPVPPSENFFKYRLVYIVSGVRILGYDNERGKGDHRHFHGVESSLTFVSIDILLEAFTSEVEKLRKRSESI